MVGLKSADSILTRVKSANGILDRAEMADSVQAGVESADLAYIVPEYAPEPEPPSYPQRNQSLTDLYQVQVAMNSIIKVYNLSLGEAKDYQTMLKTQISRN